MRRYTILAPPDRIWNLAQDLNRLEQGDLTVFDALSDAPIIEAWSFAPYTTSCITGAVRGHPTLGDRPAIVTSGLYAMDPEGQWARTLSRWYRLGHRRTDA